MTKPTWVASSMNGWPDEFSFHASCSESLTRLDGFHPAPPDAGWHMQTGGALELVLSGCSAVTVVAYHLRRAQLRR